MSIFNKTYRTDEQLAADHKAEAKRLRMKKTPMGLKYAEDIFREVVKAVEEGGITEFTKQEMIAMVRGNGSFKNGEWVMWSAYCNQAIGKIRRYFWSSDEKTTNKRLFNYVWDLRKYILVELDDADSTNLIYQGYFRKMEGLAYKQKEIALSAYGAILEMDSEERVKLLARLKEEKLIAA